MASSSTAPLRVSLAPIGGEGRGEGAQSTMQVTEVLYGENPRPDDVVQSLDFACALTENVSILIVITVE